MSKGSVLGPVLFTLYTIPLHDMSQAYNVEYMIYEDDPKINSISKSNHSEKVIRNIECCVLTIRSITETLHFAQNSPKNSPSPPYTIGGHKCTPTSHTIKNGIGVTLDSCLQRNQYITNVCISA